MKSERAVAGAASLVLLVGVLTAATGGPERASPSPGRAAPASVPTAAPVTPSAQPKARPASAGPGRLVYVDTTNIPGTPRHVFSVNADGSGRSTVSGIPDVPFFQVAKGTGLIVREMRLFDPVDQSSPQCQEGGCNFPTKEVGISISSSTGRGMHTLTRNGYDTSPAWSPDGRTIAYLSHRFDPKTKGRYDVVALMDRYGHDLGVADHPSHLENDGAFAWAPDSRSLAIVRLTPTLGVLRSPVLLVRLGGGSRVIGRGYYIFLAFAPNGRAVSGIRARAAASSMVTGFDLWLMSTDPRRPVRQLTHESTVTSTTEGKYLCGTFTFPTTYGPNSTPVWSKDSRYLAFTDNTGHHDQAGVINDLVVLDSVTGRRSTVRRLPTLTCKQYTRLEKPFVEALGWR